MRIVLAALNAKYVHSNLAVYDLEAYAKAQQRKESSCFPDSEVVQPEIVVREYTINHNLDLILQSLYQERAAVVAFSCYIWNIYEILTIAKELKKVAPDTRIWLGGPEVTYDGKNHLQNNPFLEGVMVGEGEVTFYELTKAWKEHGKVNREIAEEIRKAKLQSQRNAEDRKTTERETIGHKKEGADIYEGIPGILYRDDKGEIRQNPPRALMDLDDLPFIYDDLSVFQNKILYYETSRGCPYSCSYCLSSIEKKVRFRSLSLVRKELDFFLENRVPQVKFIDRTFNCNRKHALAIWEYLTEHDNGVTNFHFEVAADLIGEEEFAVFRKMRPGLIQLEIGLQSTNPATIQEIRRVMDVDKVKETLLTIRGFHNIHQHLDLIAGLPYENFVTFQKSFNDAYAMMPNQLQLGFLKVLKGSYMGENIQSYELQYRDVQPYEVLSTKWITYDEILILKMVEEMVEVYYNSDQFEHVLPYLVSLFESPYEFYETLGRYYEENRLFGIGFKREARYEALRNFCLDYFGSGIEEKGLQSVLSEDEKKNQDVQRWESVQNKERLQNGFSKDVFDSLLTYDYYLRENAKSRPSWSREEPIEKTVYHAFFKNGGNSEINLVKEGYDSKAAARMMHIEPLAEEALCWIVDNEDSPAKEAETGRIGTNGEDGIKTEKSFVYCLFDYENRNPLSKDAGVAVLHAV